MNANLRSSIRPKRLRRSASVFVIALAALSIVVTTLLFESREADTKSQPRLQAAHDECTDGSAATLEVGDSGRSLLVDTGESGSFLELACVLGELDTSEATMHAMDSTTAMMGVQTTEEQGLEYRWSYHPDNGLNMTITELDDRGQG